MTEANFILGIFKTITKTTGVTFEYTSTPQQNETSERMNCTLMRKFGQNPKKEIYQNIFVKKVKKYQKMS